MPTKRSEEGEDRRGSRRERRRRRGRRRRLRMRSPNRAVPLCWRVGSRHLLWRRRPNLRSGLDSTRAAIGSWLPMLPILSGRSSFFSYFSRNCFYHKRLCNLDPKRNAQKGMPYELFKVTHYHLECRKNIGIDLVQGSALFKNLSGSKPILNLIWMKSKI